LERQKAVKTEIQAERRGKRTLADVDAIESIDLTGDTMVVKKKAKVRARVQTIDLED